MQSPKTDKAPGRKWPRKSETQARKDVTKNHAAGRENSEMMYSQRLMRKAAELGITTAELERFIETGERPERKERTK